MTEVAVPFFFIVSGFFFMRYAYTSINEYFDMVKKKTKTLFVHFVLWNVLGIIPLLLTLSCTKEKNYPNNASLDSDGLLGFYYSTSK